MKTCVLGIIRRNSERNEWIFISNKTRACYQYNNEDEEKRIEHIVGRGDENNST